MESPRSTALFLFPDFTAKYAVFTAIFTQLPIRMLSLL